MVLQTFIPYGKLKGLGHYISTNIYYRWEIKMFGHFVSTNIYSLREIERFGLYGSTNIYSLREKNQENRLLWLISYAVPFSVGDTSL